MKKVLIVTKNYGAPSEVWIYRHSIGLTDYHACILTRTHINKKTYRHNRVYKLIPENKYYLILWRFYIRLRYFRAPNNKLISKLNTLRALKKTKPDIIHIHFLWNADIIANISNLKIPFIITAHGSDVHKANISTEYKKQVQIIFKRAKLIIAVSQFIASQLIKLGCQKNKIIINPLGAPLPDDIESNNKSKKNINILCVARLEEVKGHKYLIQSIALVKKAIDNVHLTIIGDGSQRNSITDLIKKLELENTITLTGALPNELVFDYYISSDIYAQHSVKVKNNFNQIIREEAMSISFVEAASHGLPLVGTQTGGVPEICHNNINGFIVEEKDIEAMADKIILLATTPTLREQLGLAGRRLVETQYDSGLQLKKLEEIYDEILND